MYVGGTYYIICKFFFWASSWKTMKSLLGRQCSSDHRNTFKKLGMLTADAWVGGTVSAPQKFKLPPKLRHLMGWKNM